MADHSRISWTETTWNPWTGCSKVSPACQNCYAETMARRLQAMGVKKYRNGFGLTIHEDEIRTPLRWKRPRMVFVCSMSDFLHPGVPTDAVLDVMRVMSEASSHTFQILTKRPERMVRLVEMGLEIPRNVWFGVTVEDQERAEERVPLLLKVPSVVRFVSAEPLLGPLDLKVAPEGWWPDGTKWMPNKNEPDDWKWWTHREGGVNWVIVGGESGPHARPMRIPWVASLRDQCIQAKVPFFFKQWGGVNKRLTGCELEGKEWKEMPKAGQIVWTGEKPTYHVCGRCGDLCRDGFRCECGG